MKLVSELNVNMAIVRGNTINKTLSENSEDFSPFFSALKNDITFIGVINKDGRGIYKLNKDRQCTLQHL